MIMIMLVFIYFYIYIVFTVRVADLSLSIYKSTFVSHSPLLHRLKSGMLEDVKSDALQYKLIFSMLSTLEQGQCNS